MPTTIPYDPSIVIGNVVTTEALSVLEAIATLQGDIDAAQDDLNSMISLQRSLGMTIQNWTKWVSIRRRFATPLQRITRR